MHTGVAGEARDCRVGKRLQKGEGRERLGRGCGVRGGRGHPRGKEPRGLGEGRGER